MGKKPIEQVLFGKFLYDRRTKVIYKLEMDEKIELAKYTVQKADSRRYFSDGELAFQLFKEELQDSTFEILAAKPGNYMVDKAD
jgi:hypothetical protein